MMKFRRYASRVLLIALILSMTAELASREVLGLGSPPLYIAHQRVEYMLRPYQEVTRFGNKVAINEYGMRSKSFPIRKVHQDELRVLVIGDSVVYGGSLLDQSDVATTRLGEMLNSRMPRPVTVGNISAKSWGPGNQLAYLKEYGTFNADNIIVVISTHDLGDVPQYGALGKATHPTFIPHSAFWEGLSVYLPRYIPAHLNPFSAKKKKKPEVDWDKMHQEGAKLLEQFLDELLASGAKPFILFHPTRKEMHEGYDKDHHTMRAIAEAKGIETFTYAKELKACADSGRDPYYDGIHLSASGQAVLAKKMLRILEREHVDLMANAGRSLPARAH